ncbi:hypothetical protein ACF0H5_005195 [Mactra antiquata]
MKCIHEILFSDALITTKLNMEIIAVQLTAWCWNFWMAVYLFILKNIMKPKYCTGNSTFTTSLYMAHNTLDSNQQLLYCTVLYCTVLYCIVLYCTVLYCTVLYCTVLYCTVLYCTVLYSDKPINQL